MAPLNNASTKLMEWMITLIIHVSYYVKSVISKSRRTVKNENGLEMIEYIWIALIFFVFIGLALITFKDPIMAKINQFREFISAEV